MNKLNYKEFSTDMPFIPDALPTLIGSLPVSDHEEATSIIFEYMQEIPLWAQLPCYPEERLLSQFAEGLPGIECDGDSCGFNTGAPDFDEQVLAFFEQYLGVNEGAIRLEESVFAFSEKTGRGFEAFIRAASNATPAPAALKGQVTGPFTMFTGLKDQNGRMAFYDPTLREAITKGIAMKARYQANALKALSENVMIFLDEPALAGFGSSAMVGIPREDAVAALSESIDSIHSAGAMAGVHVCANTDWSLVLDTKVDILSFDAFGYFDRIVLFREQLQKFIADGKIIAWGLVPTLNDNDLKNATAESLYDLWEKQTEQLDCSHDLIKQQALVTPSCGTGLLGRELSIKALELTRDLSRRIREA